MSGGGGSPSLDLASVQDAFDRVAKKQKLSYSKTEDVIDKFVMEIQQAASKLEAADAAADQRSVLMELHTKLNELNDLGGMQKEMNMALSKCGKVVDKQFKTDLSKAYRPMEFDRRLVNQIIALHFYRQGLFELGDSFVNESQETSSAALRAPFYEMYQILEQMKNKNLEPAIEWARSHHKELKDKGSALEFKLHKLEFVHTLLKQGVQEAYQYGRRSLSRFPERIKDIQQLMACLVFHMRGGNNPYAELLSASQWDLVAAEFIRECCSLLGQAYESPLQVTISAGSQALPELIKISEKMINKGEWHSLKQLPVEIKLSDEFQFHSVFACPVGKDQSTAENPPMLLPCGHVVCKQAIQRMAKGNTRPFKCPYCPVEATSAQCRQIHF